MNTWVFNWFVWMCEFTLGLAFVKFCLLSFCESSVQSILCAEKYWNPGILIVLFSYSDVVHRRVRRLPAY